MSLTAPLSELIRLLRAGLRLPHEAGSALASGAAGWAELAAAVDRHHVYVAAYRGVEVTHADIPADLRARWQRQTRAAELRAVQLEEQVSRVLTACRLAGVSPVVLKGALFAARDYPTPGMRPYADIDLLLSREDLGRAGEALAAVGYSPYRHWDGKDHDHYSAYHYHHIYTSPGRLPVELHWELTHPTSPVQLRAAELVARSVPCRLGSHEVRALSPEDEWLVLATHATKHRLQVGLISLLDFAVVFNGRQLSPELVGERARAAGAEVDLASVVALLDSVGLLAGLPGEMGRSARIDVSATADYVLSAAGAGESDAIVRALGSRSIGAMLTHLRGELIPQAARLRREMGSSFPAILAYPLWWWVRAWKAVRRPADWSARRQSRITATHLHRLFGDREAW